MTPAADHRTRAALMRALHELSLANPGAVVDVAPFLREELASLRTQREPGVRNVRLFVERIVGNVERAAEPERETGTEGAHRVFGRARRRRGERRRR
jgi:hypothetical protein